MIVGFPHKGIVEGIEDRPKAVIFSSALVDPNRRGIHDIYLASFRWIDLNESNDSRFMVLKRYFFKRGYSSGEIRQTRGYI